MNKTLTNNKKYHIEQQQRVKNIAEQNQAKQQEIRQGLLPHGA